MAGESCLKRPPQPPTWHRRESARHPAPARGIFRVCGRFSQKRRRHLPRPARSSTPDEGSPTRIGGASRATLTGDSAVNGGTVSEQIEQTRLDSGGDPGEPAVPLTEQCPQLVAQLG